MGTEMVFKTLVLYRLNEADNPRGLHWSK